jgi:ABC-type phosphate transport system substrate-binding protein
MRGDVAGAHKQRPRRSIARRVYVTSSPLDPHAQQDCARTRRSVRVAALAIAGAALLGSTEASAQTVNCTSLPNPVLGVGGSAPNALVKAVAKKLAAANPPITVVYTSTGACDAMKALVPNGTTLDALEKFTAVKPFYFDATGKEQNCEYPVGSNVFAEWGSMAQESKTCSDSLGTPIVLPDTVGDFIGPISGFSLIVPSTSTEYAISAEAIRYIYGRGIGAGGDVPPWTEVAAVATRGSSSAAGLLLAKAAQIPLRPVGYTDVKDNQGAVNHVLAAQNPNAALGFCSTETAETDANVARVRTLAFKAFDQDYAYFPNSSATSFDKKNLREGRYFLWNPHHFFANKARLTANPNLQKFIDIITSKEELPGDQNFLDLQIDVGNVPSCAMKVNRQGDMGPLVSFQPEAPCGCYFDFKTTGATSCKQCTTSADCGTGFECNVGYCEVN